LSHSANPTPLQIYKRLLGYVRPHRGAFVLGLLGAVMYSIAMSLLAPFAKVLGDGSFAQIGATISRYTGENALTRMLASSAGLSAQQDPRLIVWLPVGLVVLFVLRGLGDFIQTYYMGYVGRRIVSRMRSDVYRHLMNLPIGYFDRNSAAQLLSRLTYNSESLGQAATDSVVSIVRTTLVIAGSILILLLINVRLTLMALAIAPIVGILVSRVNRYFRRYSRRIQDSMGDVTRVAKESLEAPRLIKVYNAQDHLDRQFDAVNAHNLRSNMRLILTKGLSSPIVQLLSATGAAFILSKALSDVVHGDMSNGDLFAFFAALVGITQPLRDLIGVAGPMQQGIAAGQSLFEVLDEPVEPQGGTYTAPRVRGEVQFTDVSFSYGSGKGPALKNISFEVAAGQNIAIVGRSGSGKSTLVNLLPRFYDVKSGAVSIDGHDVRDYQLRNLRDQIAVVSQEVVLFNDTIRNNIAFGLEVSDEALERAAEAAHVLEFVREFPDGFNTMVGDRGALLSGGQRQRISIARALLKDAPILILDEATSALDTEAERHIQAALEQLVRNRTTFVIAHRLSTVEKADRIVVLDAGVMIETGTHAELLARGEMYAQLHGLQFKT
jgi:ATP-binding cassette, subfamily B, bacterial MsbA